MVGGICVIKFCFNVWFVCEGDIVGNVGMLELFGNSWFGWKFFYIDCEMFGEFFVIR